MARSLSKEIAFAVGALMIGLPPLFAPAVRAEDAVTVHLSLKDHRFEPAEPHAPAGKPITIEIKNLDGTPAEFESKTLRVEKVIAAGGVVTVQIRPLAAGRYRFFDDYHEDTTEGSLIVQ
ncbi:MAG: cupredoxin domain-containing protein [Methylocella sp.]